MVNSFPRQPLTSTLRTAFDGESPRQLESDGVQFVIDDVEDAAVQPHVGGIGARA